MLSAGQLRITTLSENTSTGVGILGEWGLSVLVEAAGQSVLVDTGASGSVGRNLQTLAPNLAKVQAIVLSHCHYDHTGGLREVLDRMRKDRVRIIAHPGLFRSVHSRNRKTGRLHYTGLPFNREELERLGAVFELSSQPTWLSEEIAASGEEPMTTDFESVSPDIFVREGEAFRPDDMADDQSLYIRTELGLVIVLGCAHRGMINIIRHARTLMGTEQVYMVVGGTHLGPAPEPQVTRTIAALQELGVQWVGVSHCTGLKVAARLSRELGDRFFFNNAGTAIRFPFKPG
jgi:7,8-dihydropterin-6-yl-methyl-4-(beta-D-ribofuranosyl)aminobenzene 5'-phosphate synthase